MGIKPARGPGRVTKTRPGCAAVRLHDQKPDDPGDIGRFRVASMAWGNAGDRHARQGHPIRMGPGQNIPAALKSLPDPPGLKQSAALAFYTLFSMAPILVLVMAAAGLLLGTQAAQGALLVQLKEMFGPQGAAAVQESGGGRAGARFWPCRHHPRCHPAGGSATSVFAE